MTNLTLDEKKALIRMALEAREQAYVPYSDFMVGAALRADDGRIFTGCNVENAAFTPTSCAERTALFKAVSEGVTRFTDIAVVGSRRGEVNKQITSPCGVCRQALFEFGGPELNVIMAKTPDDFIERSMDELLPFGFGPSNVAGNKAVEEGGGKRRFCQNWRNSTTFTRILQKICKDFVIGNALLSSHDPAILGSVNVQVCAFPF